MGPVRWKAAQEAYVSQSGLDELAALQDFKEAYKGDKTAWTITAALVLTICIPAAMIGAQDHNSSNAYNKEVLYVYVAALTCCAASSMLCISNATTMYLKINMLPATLVPKLLDLVDSQTDKLPVVHYLLGSAMWAKAAMGSVSILLICAVYLFYGATYLYLSTPIIVLAVLLAVYHQRQARSWHYQVLHLEPAVDLRKLSVRRAQVAPEPPK